MINKACAVKNFYRQLGVLGLIAVFGDAYVCFADTASVHQKGKCGFIGEKAQADCVDDSEVDGDTATERSSSRDIGGFYLGLGLSLQHCNRKVVVKDNMGDVIKQQYENLSHIYKNKDGAVLDKGTNRLGGTVVVGYDALLGNDVLVGIQGCLDFSGQPKVNASREFADTTNLRLDREKYDYWSVRSSGCAVVPSLSLKLGYRIGACCSVSKGWCGLFEREV